MKMRPFVCLRYSISLRNGISALLAVVFPSGRIPKPGGIYLTVD